MYKIIKLLKILGQAAFLKNIKIEGGAAANVRLRKPEECQQYCTGKLFCNLDSLHPWILKTLVSVACIKKSSAILYKFTCKKIIYIKIKIEKIGFIRL